MTRPTRAADTSSPRRFHRDVSGILLLDKPLGLSSNAALQQVRALFHARKAGHAGSLDPLADGLLPICFGQATKVCGRLLNSGKTYRVMLSLGARTESGDCETEIVERAAVPVLDDERVDAVLRSFIGEQDQVPPMHSALKFAGQRLYELARRGETVDRPARRITVRRLARVNRGATSLQFDVECSKGTYVRTLAADIAARLGTLGYVESLRRLSVDPFAGESMHRLNDLTHKSETELAGLLLPIDRALTDLPSVHLGEAGERALLLGQAASPSEPATAGLFRAYGAGGRFLGLVEGEAQGRVRPERLFVDVPAGRT